MSQTCSDAAVTKCGNLDHGRQVRVRVLALVLVLLVQTLASQADVSVPSGAERLSFEDRVRHQRAIEEVYWQHRIWPAENPGIKPALVDVLSEEQIRERVNRYLEQSAALEVRWPHSLTVDSIQAELDRMLRRTRAPEVLSELFAALDNDPFLVAECLVRPLLADRLIRERYETMAPDGLPFETWWAQEDRTAVGTVAVRSATTTLPHRYELRSPLGGGCDLDAWASVAYSPPARQLHTAVWTGAEMIVWGGQASNVALEDGARYDPATDTWVETETFPGMPAGRYNHTAVWTGTEMIVWGGDVDPSGTIDATRTGGRYNPTSDSWTPTSLATDCPSDRKGHSAVWTGTEMIVWGGSPNFGIHCADGARYDPTTNVWRATSDGPGVPYRRSDHTAIWTGSEMIVWGGIHGGSSGGRYDPSIDAWTPITRGGVYFGSMWEHTAVWTGSEMIVWGGFGTNSNLGGRYDPLTDVWVPLSTDGVPEHDNHHASVWTGTEMIVWGGYNPTADTGSRYDPVTDTWTATSVTAGTPAGRYRHTAIWTGEEMIVWGGYGGGSYLDSGGSYCACSGGPVSTWYPDADGDGLGMDTTSIPACAQPPGYIANGGDCDDRYFDCTTDCTDADSDGLPACGPDCDDLYASCTFDCSDPDIDLVPDCRDNCPGIYNPSQTDDDMDTWGLAIGCDCNDTEPGTYPGAPEINDGLDNQCPGYAGFGLVDEIEGVLGFHDRWNRNYLSWTAQSGATAYQLARSTDPMSSASCVLFDTTDSFWIDSDPVPLGVTHHYLVRSSQPFSGSWGANSEGEERTVCP